MGPRDLYHGGNSPLGSENNPSVWQIFLKVASHQKLKTFQNSFGKGFIRHVWTWGKQTILSKIKTKSFLCGNWKSLSCRHVKTKETHWNLNQDDSQTLTFCLFFLLSETPLQSPNDIWRSVVDWLPCGLKQIQPTYPMSSEVQEKTPDGRPGREGKI